MLSLVIVLFLLLLLPWEDRDTSIRSPASDTLAGGSSSEVWRIDWTIFRLNRRICLENCWVVGVPGFVDTGGEDWLS